MNYRIEHDTMGEVRVPEDALYGPQTQRAVENFPVSGRRFPRAFIQALGLIKARPRKRTPRPANSRKTWLRPSKALPKKSPGAATTISLSSTFSRLEAERQPT